MFQRSDHSRSTTIVALAAATALLTLAACSSSTSGGSSSPPAGSPPSSAAPTSATSSAAVSSVPVSSSATSPSSAASPSTGSGSTGSSTSSAAGSTAGGGCSPAALKTAAAGKLTIATSEPAFEPWMVDDDPTNGKGYESAVAYAVAENLGYGKDQVSWTRVNFDEALNRQDGWDFDINQFTITAARQKVVDFSSGYYDLAQAVVTVKGSPIEKATTVAVLKDVQLGAMSGTTSLDAIDAVIAPSKKPSVFKSNDLGVQALQNGQIDGLVVDLPTAFYMAGAQLDNGIVLGQLPGTASAKEQLGLLLAKDSPITSCVTGAVDALRQNGTLAKLATTWLAGKDTAPVLK